MRSKFALGAAALAVGLALAGCASSTQSNGSDNGDNNSKGPVTLRFQSLAFQAPTIAATKKIVADWNTAHPDVHVQYVQGSWDSVQDQLVTQFQGGTAPDIIQYESAAMTGFAQQGYLADLSPYLTSAVKSSVSPGIWKTVTVDGKIIAAPTLLQSYLVFANTDKLKAAGVTVPTGDSWSWSDFEAAAKATTSGGTYGVGWGLSEPTASMLSLGMNFGAKFFNGTGSNASISIGNAEMALPELIHKMAYEEKSLDPVSLTQSGGDVLPAFVHGKYAMTVQGSYAAQSILETAPKDFHWAVLPPLSATSANQAADPQTLSVSAQSANVQDAAEFINYFMAAKNLAAVAEGDWLIPASSAASKAVISDTGGANGWPVVLASGNDLTEAPFQSVADYPQWKDQIATPAYQQYLGNKISADELKSKLTDGWSQVSGG
jgi:multiple sugar transport system substrate-binding protein